LTLARQSIHGGWATEWTFIAAATTSTLGLGNLWKFAYLAGANGGAAFVLAYLACVAVVGAPVLVAEVVLGARGRSDPIHAVEAAARESAVSRRWRFVGWLSCATALVILSYFSVVGGWLLTYMQHLYEGDLAVMSARQAGELFGQLLADGGRQAGMHAVFMAMTWLVVALGVSRGLGWVLRLCLPLLLILLLAMVLFAIRIGDVAAALHFMFAPHARDWHADAMLTALGQAFFSLSIGMAAMMAYGAYTPDRRSIMRLVGAVVLLDVLVALLAGLAIFPLVFAQHVQPNYGPGLMFVTLPYIFGNVANGAIVGTAFFALVLLAAFGSAVSLLEPATAWLVQRYRWRRPLAALLLAGMVWLLGLLSVFSFSLWPDWRPGGKSLFAWFDWACANIALPLIGLGVAVFVGWRMRKEAIRDELFVEHPRFFFLWHWLLRYIAPPAIVIVMAAGLYRWWTQLPQ
jgi:NSS family neurotransmitter:Na+ symporter